MNENRVLTLLSLIKDLKIWADDILDPSDATAAKPNLGKITELANKYPEGRPDEDSEQIHDYWEQVSSCIDLSITTFRESCDALTYFTRAGLSTTDE